MAIICSSCTEKKQEVPQDLIWYQQPAEDWMQALPVGNGRLGAMVFGKTKEERIQLNEDSMWPGGYDDWEHSKGSPADLAEIREALKDGKPHLADSLIVSRFSFKGIGRSHQTMGDLYINYQEKGEPENYKRSLNLEDGLAEVQYTLNGHQYTQKVFSSAVDNVLVVHISTDAEDGLSFNLRLDRPEDEGHKTVEVTTPSDNEMSMKGMVTQYSGAINSQPLAIDHGVAFETRLLATHQSGTIKANGEQLQLKNVKEATLYLVCNTSFYHDKYEEKNVEQLAALDNETFTSLYNKHLNDYKELYNRVSFHLGDKALDSIPTDKRLTLIKEGKKDLGMVAKLFNYGRYLLISSSRPGTNPANLQGIWNDHIMAPWNADYHLNINIQMNYWPAGVTNLSELQMPLFDFSDALLENGKKIAKEQYGIHRGAMIHHTTDLWKTPFMRAERPYWGSWIHGGGWLAQHYWEHYRYTQDQKFLQERGYPFLKEIAAFYLDWLVLDERDGTWVSAPETSPENSYVALDGKPAAVSYGNAMGHQIIAEVFDNTIAAATVLGIQDDFIKEVKEKREKLHEGVVIGEDGRILEWDQPYEEHEKGHRHMSHLYALHPGDAITSENKEAFEAAKKTIAYRLAHGGAGTGWSRAWMISFNARLFDAASAQENITKFMQISTADNLFDEHPPFQIDGNFGFTAGVAELLMQSHEGFIRILPALPPDWKNGDIQGLVARGNIEVGIQWEQGRLKTLQLKAKKNTDVEIVYKGEKVTIALKKGKVVTLDQQLSQLKSS